ncbi:MAG: SGNH/GDSL hydrolase family protein [bacterium]
MKKNAPRPAKNLLFCAIALVVFLGSLEAVLRIARFEFAPDHSPIVAGVNEAVGNFEEIFTPSPDTLWKHKAGSTYRFDARAEAGGRKVKFVSTEEINSDGFRGAPVPRERQPRAVRLAFLGDSSTFGSGIPVDGTYVEILRRLLGEKFGDRSVRFEVINAGVIGYSSTQGLAHFRQNVIPFKPDVVVIAFGSINESRRTRYTDVEAISVLSRPPLALVISGALAHARVYQLIESGLSKITDMGANEHSMRVPPEQFVKDLESFYRLSRRHGFVLVPLTPHRRRDLEVEEPVLPRYTAEVAAFAERHGLPLVDIHGAFRNEAPEDVVFLPKDSYHPGPFGHVVIARKLFETLEPEVEKMAAALPEIPEPPAP